jgi:hypothetical protein
MRALFAAMILVSLSAAAMADSSTLDAAIGGGLGGAAGAAIGNELGGRDGAIIGGAIGGGVGAAVTTPEDKKAVDRRRYDYDRYHRQPDGHPHYRFCPPGQAKKGRC